MGRSDKQILLADMLSLLNSQTEVNISILQADGEAEDVFFGDAGKVYKHLLKHKVLDIYAYDEDCISIALSR